LCAGFGLSRLHASSQPRSTHTLQAPPRNGTVHLPPPPLHPVNDIHSHVNSSPSLQTLCFKTFGRSLRSLTCQKKGSVVSSFLQFVDFFHVLDRLIRNLYVGVLPTLGSLASTTVIRAVNAGKFVVHETVINVCQPIPRLALSWESLISSCTERGVVKGAEKLNSGGIENDIVSLTTKAAISEATKSIYYFPEPRGARRRAFIRLARSRGRSLSDEHLLFSASFAWSLAQRQAFIRFPRWRSRSLSDEHLFASLVRVVARSATSIYYSPLRSFVWRSFASLLAFITRFARSLSARRFWY